MKGLSPITKSEHFLHFASCVLRSILKKKQLIDLALIIPKIKGYRDPLISQF